MKYLVSTFLSLILLNSFVSMASNDEECYQIAVHQMLNGDYENAIESFEMVLKANPTHCEALSYVTECNLALLMLAECKEDALQFAEKTIEYAERSKGDFAEDGKPVYYSILAKNQAALWGHFYDDFKNAEYEVYKYFETYGDDILGWYTLGDYYLTCSYFPDRQFLKSYNSEIIDPSFFIVPLDCLMEDARYAFQRCTDYKPNTVLGNYGFMEIALYKKDMEELRKSFNAIKHKNYLAPLEATLQYFAVVLYDDCLIDEFYDQIDIEFDKSESKPLLIGSIAID